jgi:hypothetical protein
MRIMKSGSRERFWATVLLTLTALLAAAPAASQETKPDRAAVQDTTAASSASVTSLAGTTVYVNAGRADGLLEGMELQVIRHDSVASTLRVEFLSSHQSACQIVRGASDVVIGERVRFYPQLTASASAQTGAALARRRGTRRLSGPGLHGRVGARYLRAQEDPTNTGFDQPSLDMRMDGQRLFGTPIGLAADLRTRRTVTSTGGGNSTVDGHTRVYQAALLWNAPGAGFRVAAGRQYLTAVTSVSLFDGALMELNGSHLTFGAFGGFEPEPADLGFSSTIRDLGGYVQLHSRPGGRGTWAFTTGAVTSYANGKANREFAFGQLSVSTQYLSLYGLQEVDYYRPWKVQLGEKSVSPTNTYISGSIRPTRWLAFNGSYDDRRSVRLYRDAVDPATAFDDSYREGYGAGLALLGQRVRASGDWHHSSGGTSGKAVYYTSTLGVDRLTKLRFSVTGRGTWYTNTDATTNTDITGWLYTGRVGFDPFGPLHVDLNGGVRNEDNHTTTPAVSTRHTWFGVDSDLSLARAWFISFSGQREQGPSSTTTQFYGSITWRF